MIHQRTKPRVRVEMLPSRVHAVLHHPQDDAMWLHWLGQLAREHRLLRVEVRDQHAAHVTPDHVLEQFIGAPPPARELFFEYLGPQLVPAGLEPPDSDAPDALKDFAHDFTNPVSDEEYNEHADLAAPHHPAQDDGPMYGLDHDND